MDPTEDAQPIRSAEPPRRAKRLLVNVLSGWLAVGVNLFIGFVLSPYMIRKLGADRYGIWALVLAVADYLLLFDLGFKSALINFSAKAHALGDNDGVNRAINTSLAIFSVTASASIVVVLILFTYAQRLFKLDPVYRGEFSTLVLITGIGWSVSLVVGVFRGGLESFSLFRVNNTIWMASSIVRATGWGLLLYFGYGPVQMAVTLVAAQLGAYAVAYPVFRRAFPALQLSRRFVSWQCAKDMAHFGFHTVVAGVSLMFLNQGVPVLVGHFLPSRFVGFYSLPTRFLQVAMDSVSRVGAIMTPNATEMAARGETAQIVRMGTFGNRYCYILTMPLTVFLCVYRWELIYVWVGQEFAVNSARLMPVMALSLSFGAAAQFCSSCILYGIAKHQRFARSLTFESAFSVIGLFIISPRYGIFGAAIWTSLLLVLNRGLYTPWLFCRNLDASYLTYMREIYLRPTALAIPLWMLGSAIRTHWVAGRNWPELFFVLGLLAAVYYTAGFLLCAEPEHRGAAVSWISRRLGRKG